MAKARVMQRKETGEMEVVDTEPQLITDEMAELIGDASEPVTLEVERGAIRRYAQASDDPNPLYSDVDYARENNHKDLLCPPGFFGWPIKQRFLGGGSRLREIMDKLPRRLTTMDNGGEIEFLSPIYAGDTLTAVTGLTDVYEEIGRSGNRLILTINETTYVNQDGDTVAKVRSRALHV